MKPLSPVNKLQKNNMLPCLPMSYYPSIIIIIIPSNAFPSFSLPTLNRQTNTHAHLQTLSETPHLHKLLSLNLHSSSSHFFLRVKSST
jgi:hypothetical protein